MGRQWRTAAHARRLRREGRAAEAIALVDGALTSMDGESQWRRRTTLLNERALAEIQIGRIVMASETLHAALEVVEAAGRTASTSYITVLDNLGFVAREAGNLSAAAEWHQMAIGIAERIRSPALLSRSLANAAIVYKDRGLLGKARAFLERATAVAPARDLRLRGHLHAIGALLSQLKQEFDDARRQHILSLVAYRNAFDVENEALELHNLAVVEHLRGRPAVAARLLRKSMKLNREMDFDPGAARDLLYLALFTFDSGQRQAGLNLLRQAWHALAEVDDMEGMLWCELDMARIGTVAGTFDRALALLDHALARAGTVGDPLLEYNLLVARGRVHQQLGAPADAKRDYAAAIVRAESLRAGIRDEDDALSFFRFAQWSAFDALIELCADQGDAAGAWQCSQNARGREMQRRLRFDPEIVPRGVSPSAIERERELLDAYRSATAVWRSGHRAEALPRLERLERELSVLWDAIAVDDPEYVSVRRGDTIDLAGLRELLRI